MAVPRQLATSSVRHPGSRGPRSIVRAATTCLLALAPLGCGASGDGGDDGGRLLDHLGAAVTEIALGGELRPAYRADERPAVTFPLEVPAGGGLEVAAGLACAAAAPCVGETRFAVSALAESGGRTPLLTLRLAASEAGHWVSRRVDLGALAGREVRFELTARPGGGDAAGRGGDRAVPLWAEPLLLAPSPSPRPLVLLVSIDTLRADRLGSYGHPEPISPVLDRLAEESVRFERAYSQAPWTTPSHVSLLTSLYPSSHGVNLDWGSFMEARTAGGLYPGIPPKVPTLAELLGDAGYRTVALTGGGPIAGEIGFARGFDRYLHWTARLRPWLLPRLRELLDAYGDSPLFLFLHTFEVHAPYRHGELARARGLVEPEELEAMGRVLARPRTDTIVAQRRFLQERGLYRPEVTSALYDGGIRYTDHFLGRIFELLREAGLWEEAIVVVTSDHGEEFADHSPDRFFDAHCTTVHEELVRVPLLIRAPGRIEPGEVVARPVELVDVVPTILELLDLPVPTSIEGGSLLAASREPGDGGAALSEATCIGPEMKALRTPDDTYIAAFEVEGPDRSGLPGPRRWEKLFDPHRDPTEQSPLAGDGAEGTARLRTRLGERFRSLAEGSASPRLQPIDGDLLRALEALGYVEGGEVEAQGRTESP